MKLLSLTSNTLALTSNYKTYATVAIGLVLAGLQVFDPALLAKITPVLNSPYLDMALSMAGLGFLRLGVAKQTKVSQDAVVAFQALLKAYTDVTAAVTVPVPPSAVVPVETKPSVK